MTDRYIAFDVETPNWANDRMSAIGIAVIEDGEIAGEFYTVVDPETYFDRFNIDLTGITPEMAADSPAFPEVWHEIEPIMSSGLLVAHNAPFDMSVLQVPAWLRHRVARRGGLRLHLPDEPPADAAPAEPQAEHHLRLPRSRPESPQRRQRQPCLR